MFVSIFLHVFVNTIKLSRAVISKLQIHAEPKNIARKPYVSHAPLLKGHPPVTINPYAVIGQRAAIPIKRKKQSEWIFIINFVAYLWTRFGRQTHLNNEYFLTK